LLAAFRRKDKTSALRPSPLPSGPSSWTVWLNWFTSSANRVPSPPEMNSMFSRAGFRPTSAKSFRQMWLIRRA